MLANNKKPLLANNKLYKTTLYLGQMYELKTNSETG